MPANTSVTEVGGPILPRNTCGNDVNISHETEYSDAFWSMIAITSTTSMMADRREWFQNCSRLPQKGIEAIADKLSLHMQKPSPITNADNTASGPQMPPLWCRILLNIYSHMHDTESSAQVCKSLKIFHVSDGPILALTIHYSSGEQNSARRAKLRV